MTEDSELETRLKEETYSLMVSDPPDTLAIRIFKFAGCLLGNAEGTLDWEDCVGVSGELYRPDTQLFYAVIRNRALSADLTKNLVHPLMVNVEELVLRYAVLRCALRPCLRPMHHSFMLHLTILLITVYMHAKCRSTEQVGVMEAWTQALKAMEPFAELAGDGKEDALCAEVSETLQRFWEGIAAHILQPYDPMAVFACTACKLLDAGSQHVFFVEVPHACSVTCGT